MLNTNEKYLVEVSVAGTIHHPTKDAYIITRLGKPTQYPGSGGITYNVTVGDNAFGLMGNYIEPDVSTKNLNDDENAAFKMLSCTGNHAVVLTGEAKGATGYVLGTNDHVEHVIIHFSQEVKEKLVIGDKIQVFSFGTGLELTDYKNVAIKHLDPNLLHKMNIIEKDGRLEIPVTCEIPGCLMGASSIMSGDIEMIKEYGIDKLKFGDFVCINDTDTLYGRDYLRGSCTIGIVIHSDCMVMGHGTGIGNLITCRDNTIVPILDKNANIANYINK